MNPGGSVKDRAALGILNDAIKNKKLKKNGIIVEGTAGNTGISLTQLGNSMNGIDSLSCSADGSCDGKVILDKTTNNNY